MIGKITQGNLYLILPGKVSWIADIMLEETGADMIDAIKAIYSSDMYRRLEIEKTKMWHLGPVDLYDEMVSASGREIISNTSK